MLSLMSDSFGISGTRIAKALNFNAPGAGRLGSLAKPPSACADGMEDVVPIGTAASHAPILHQGLPK